MRMKSTLMLGAAATLALAGCQSGLENLGPRTQTGAATGAVIGGLIGASSSNNRAGKAVIGAAVGAAVGGLIGQELDRQADDLRAAIGNDDVSIVNTGSELIVTLPNDILFATDSAVVSNLSRGDLAALARNLQDYPNSTVEVIGHTDDEGDASYNVSLSRRRAASVAAVLFDNGVSSHRVVTIGMGEDRPVATNLTPEGRQQNRRVEIIIRPNA
ncbi:OmpA family protein [Aliiroseovarius sp.]|uniref:OmpA family protein n=1 Tax=Aliiroseovarius sp. TaxID=1872442 RepID=UPI003BAA76ED